MEGSNNNIHDRYNFPILMLASLDHDERFIQHLNLEAMEQLGEEISMAFQRCCVPECQVTEKECRENEIMLDCVMRIDSLLLQKERALRQRFHEKMLTLTNMQALFSMCDPHIRTGKVACLALHLLAAFGYHGPNSLPWTLHFPDTVDNNQGESSSSSCSFAMKKIATMSKALILYPCEESSWIGLSHALKRSCQFETPIDNLEIVSDLDWPKILQAETAWVEKDPHMITFYDMIIFTWLHKYVCHVLHNDRDNTKAKSILREQLGSCHELLRTVLRRIITGELFAPDPICRGHSRWDEIENISEFFKRFTNCLAPSVPIDRETKALIRRARNSLLQVIFDIMPTNFRPPAQVDVQCIQIYHAHRIIVLLKNWQQDFSGESHQAQWDRFQAEIFPTSPMQLDPIGDLQRIREEHEKSKTSTTSSGRAANNNNNNQNHHQEECANCCVLKKQLFDQCSERLMDCGRCRKVAYCSRECQVEHWKKGHKKHCKKVIVDGTPPVRSQSS